MISKKTLLKTESVCPVCLERIDAFYIEKNSKVYIDKNCKEHGSFSTIVFEDINFFNTWKADLAFEKADKPIKSKESGCPYSCGICDMHMQKTCCVLLELTKRCNLSCPVCFALASTDKSEDISLAEIEKYYDFLLSKGGPFNIQLSGGEASLRDDLVDIISMGRSKGFSYFQLNTNGIRLANDKKYFEDLKNAGLNTIFLQFDGFKDETYKYLRAKNILTEKIKAIKNAHELAIGVVLVPTIKKGINDDEIGDIIKFAFENLPTVRGVHFQPMSFFGRYKKTPKNIDRMTLDSVLYEIENQTKCEISRKDFRAGGAEHYFCSFSADFTFQNNKITAVKKENTNTCCSSKQARNVQERKWTLSNSINNNLNKSYKSLDDFIETMEKKTLSISCMAFQDAWTLDLERLKRCYIHELDENLNLVPFCSYNLTNIAGESLYR